jgi:hypothetical protein
MVSDADSIVLAKFYRQFNRADRYAEFSAVGPASTGEQGDGRFVLLNMPVLFERELTGGVYDVHQTSGSSGRFGDYTACARLATTSPGYGQPVLDTLLGDGWTERALQVQRPFDRNPAYARAELYRCGAPP